MLSPRALHLMSRMVRRKTGSSWLTLIFRALKRLEGDRDLLVEQMVFYLEDSPILIREMEDSVERQDRKQLQVTAHRLRGLSSGFDAHLLVEIAAQMEEMGRRESLDGASNLQRQFRLVWEHTCAALKEYIDFTAKS